MARLPPQPIGVPPGHSYWNDWYEKLRDLVDLTVGTYQAVSQKNQANGYAGLNGASRTTKGVDTTDDVVIDLATKGLVLKDTQATPRYWRVTINNTGSLVTTDLGTTKP